MFEGGEKSEKRSKKSKQSKKEAAGAAEVDEAEFEVKCLELLEESNFEDLENAACD